MKKIITPIICFVMLAFASVCFAEKAVPVSDLTPALGAVKSGGKGKYDFKRANHDLRLENVVMNATVSTNGSVIIGTFTLTHLYKGPFGVHIRPADHILVSFKAENGKTDSQVTYAKGKNPWGFIVAAGATVAGAPPTESAGAAAAVTGLSSKLSGDAGPFMAQVIVSLSDRLASLSKKKYE